MLSNFRLTKENILRLGWLDPEALSMALGELDCDIKIGLREYGDSFKTHLILFSASCSEFRRIASALLVCALGDYDDFCLPIKSRNVVNCIKINISRPSYSKVGQQSSFKYAPRRLIKRYPWYPSSLKFDALTELPIFGVSDAQGSPNCILSGWRCDLQQPSTVCIGGYPKALIRLARLLLDYANTDIPPEEVDLEIEGGFRGVGPCSYEARFERVDT